jgi:hypothetical protein
MINIEGFTKRLTVFSCRFFILLVMILLIECISGIDIPNTAKIIPYRLNLSSSKLLLLSNVIPIEIAVTADKVIIVKNISWTLNFSPLKQKERTMVKIGVKLVSIPLKTNEKYFMNVKSRYKAKLYKIHLKKRPLYMGLGTLSYIAYLMLTFTTKMHMIVAKKLLPNKSCWGWICAFLKYKNFAIRRLTEKIKVFNIIYTEPIHFLFCF